MNQIATPVATNGIYYGWSAMVPAAFAILLITNGLTVGGILAWDPALIQALGVNRGAIKAGDMWQLGVTAVLTLLTGKLVDRFGFRWVITLGIAALMWGFYSLGQVQSLNDYWWSRIWMGIGLSGAGMAICMVATSRWFFDSRGLAVGLVLGGTSIGNGFMPPIFTAIIHDLGWRSATLSTVALLALVPLLVWGLMREWPTPQDLARLPPTERDRASIASGQDLGYAAILRRAEFWLLGGAAFCTFYSFLGLNNNLMLHAIMLGQPQSLGAAMFVPLFLAGLVGKVAAGWLSDRVGRKIVWLCCLTLMLLGAAGLASLQVGWIWPAAVALGLGWGANYSLLQAVTGDVFGTRSLGRVMGAITVLDAGGGALGPWATAALSDRSGDYQNGFLLICVLIACAIACAAALKIKPV